MFSKIYSQIKAPSLVIQGEKPTDKKTVGAGYRYTETDQEEANKELSRILGLVGSDTKAIESGALRLVQNWDGSFELKKRTLTPYHLFSFLGWGRDIEAADNYVRGVMKAALGCDSNATNHPLSSYLTNKGKMTTEEVVGCLSTIVARDIELEEKRPIGKKSLLASTGGTLSMAKTGNKVLAMETESQLPLLGIKLGNKIGSGGFGTVYHAALKGQQEQRHVVKIEQIDDSSFKNIKEDGDKLPFDQRGELTAWTAKNIPCAQVMRPVFVIVAIKKTSLADIEYHYLSPSEAKAFTKKIGDQYPKAKAAIAAELMEYIPGESLEEIVRRNKTFFDPSSWGFKNTLNGLFKEFKAAYENHIIHRDRKPANIIVTGKLDEKDDNCIKSIDYGLAARVPVSGVFSRIVGTWSYMAPHIRLDKNYGPQVDAYSIAMTLLQLIDPSSFNTFSYFLQIDKNNGQYGSGDSKFNDFVTQMKEIDGTPESYLNAYFKQVHSVFAFIGPPPAAQKILNKSKNARIKDLIGRCFQVAAGGTNVESNFKDLYQKFAEFQKENGYQL
ncbi:MAG: protein kinase family protein [Chthoniobacterales bacterium]|nr:protein kinase family protein [Chthoniobacterales bacterium]